MLLKLILLLLTSSISCNQLKTPRVQLNEELEADTQVANLTHLIHSLLNKTVSIRSVKFSAQTDLNDYFRLESKQISFSSRIVNTIDLKASSKRLDREFVCATQKQIDCLVTLKLTALLENDHEIEVEVPLQINDINDNKPAFHQTEIKIDIDLNKPTQQQVIKIPLKQAYDLDSSYENRVQNYSLSKSFNNQMQIRFNQRSLVLIINTTDLDVTKRELVELRAYDPDFETSQLIEINFNLRPRFQIFERNFYNLTHTQPIRLRLNKTTNQQCTPEFAAYNAKVNKPIRAEFKLVDDERFLELSFVGRLTQVRLVAKCGDLNDTAFLILNELVNSSAFNLNLVAAMNDLDINETQNIIEFKFKLNQLDAAQSSSSSSSSVTNSSFVTLAYLIAEQPQQIHATTNFKYKLNREINKLDDNYHDLIRIDEMRNGLYAFKLSTKYLDTIKLLNSPNLDKRSLMPPSVAYTLRLNLLVSESDLTIQRVIKLNLPSLHLIQTNTELTRKSSTVSSSIPPVTAATLLSNFNLFNSVVLITIVSVVLILIALGCFIISLSLYLKSKCKQMNEIKKAAKKEELIDSKLSEKKMYNLRGESSIELGSAESGISSGQPSSASSTSDLSCNNSTITTTTHNGFNQQTNRSSWVNNNAIMVYDVMPSKSNQSSSASSSSSSSNYQNSSNISPVTTTSGVESALSNSSSNRNNAKQSLLQLSAKHLESDYENNSNNMSSSKESKDVMYKWYMNTTNELIRPLPVKPTSATDTCDASASSLNTDYRNEIYRNSHLIFKNNAQYCQLKKNLPTVVVKKQSDETASHKSQDFKTYEAKPISLNINNNLKDIYSTTSNSNANYTCTTSSSNNMNSAASSLDNYDTVNFDSLSTNSINFVSNALTREKLFNRLSTANSVASSENSSNQARINTYAKVSLSMIDPEQQISSV